MLLPELVAGARRACFRLQCCAWGPGSLTGGRSHLGLTRGWHTASPRRLLAAPRNSSCVARSPPCCCRGARPPRAVLSVGCASRRTFQNCESCSAFPPGKVRSSVGPPLRPSVTPRPRLPTLVSACPLSCPGISTLRPAHSRGCQAGSGFHVSLTAEAQRPDRAPAVHVPPMGRVGSF